jgi:hypothetical protein
MFQDRESQNNMLIYSLTSSRKRLGVKDSSREKLATMGDTEYAKLPRSTVNRYKPRGIYFTHSLYAFTNLIKVNMTTKQSTVS